MRKKIILLILFVLFFMAHPGWAQLSRDQERRLKELEEKEETWKAWDKNRSELERKLEELGADDTDLKGWRQKKKDNSAGSSTDESTGRYQAVRMDSNAVFILDTKEGHLWVWVIQKDNRGRPSEFLFYQGRVVPGSGMGELIDRTYKKAP